MRSLGSLLTLVLHQAVDLEPVGPPAVPRARLGHADHEALPQPASLAGRPVLLVDDALVVVAALLDHRLVVAAPAEEALAALAGERSKVESDHNSIFALFNLTFTMKKPVVRSEIFNFKKIDSQKKFQMSLVSLTNLEIG